MKKSMVFLLCFLLTVFLASGCARNDKEADIENKQNKEKTKTEATVDREIQSRQIEPEEPEQVNDEDKKLPLESDQPDQQEQDSRQNKADLDELQTLLDEMLMERRSIGEQWAVYAERISDGATVSSGNETLESASLIKLYTAAVAEKIRDELEVQETYPGETDQLLKNMIYISDNDATNTLVNRIGGGDAAAGMERINTFCQEQGFTETHMGRLMLDFDAVDDNFTSPRDCVSLLHKLYNGQLEGSGQIIEFMKLQERTGKIPAGLPVEVTCANKTGELENVENDAAIVFTETGDYIVCIMSNQLIDTANARNLFIQLSEIIFQYMGKP